ncbi:hypothetical protein AKJ39_02600 [candidate division MSBL1 archaeon SCGC-AAA259J03]|uniref:Uncharacterized protein n=1 Tax=candidate division MSBL1 archaeon SCGC-AAA259J03 TaxID=1698269 RepID=A0A656YW86_9EURY|nr:hypothetical protein AKJ39_02600 [candidate division MSBL1 archaeon SCGC-AAA259J03]
MELSVERHDSVERLSNRLGVDEASVRDKIEEIKLREKIRKLARGTKDRLKKHRGRRFKKYGTKIKRKVRSKWRSRI